MSSENILDRPFSAVFVFDSVGYRVDLDSFLWLHIPPLHCCWAVSWLLPMTGIQLSSNQCDTFLIYVVHWKQGNHFIILLFNCSRGESYDTFNQFIPAILSFQSQARIWISNVICRDLFYVQWFELRWGWSLCWYWRNCWPLPFKLLTIAV